MRYFKHVNIKKINDNKYKIINSHGRYHISKYQTPLDAAKKVFSNLVKDLEKEINIILCEITRDSNNSLYFYKGTKIKLDNPKNIYFKKYNKHIEIRYKNIVKAMSSKELNHPQVLRNWIEIIP